MTILWLVEEAAKGQNVTVQPWEAGIYILDTDRDMEMEMERWCSGALVSSQHVITAGVPTSSSI